MCLQNFNSFLQESILRSLDEQQDDAPLTFSLRPIVEGLTCENVEVS